MPGSTGNIGEEKKFQNYYDLQLECGEYTALFFRIMA